MAAFDWQHWAALAIVAVAAWSVSKRLWGQIAAFRSRPLRHRNRVPAKAVPPAPLVQIQLRPPVHLKRPPSDGPA